MSLNPIRQRAKATRSWSCLQLIFLAITSKVLAGPPAGAAIEPPSDSECPPLPLPKRPLSFGVGEELEYQLDAIGAVVGKLTLRVLPHKEGSLPVEATVQTNSFFSKIRPLKAVATSYLSPKALTPTRYVEDAVDSSVHKSAKAVFAPKDNSVLVEYQIGDRQGQEQFHAANHALDPAGMIYRLRQLPFRSGTKICFDSYGIRKLWRLWGTIEGKEHLSLPLGEFEAWHLSGHAMRLDDHQHHREIHLWVSADEQRLPLVTSAAAVRATLTAVSRPGEKKSHAQGANTLKW